MNNLTNKYKKQLLLLGIGGFCLFIFSFVMGMLSFIRGELLEGIIWSAFLVCNFFTVYTSIKEHKKLENDIFNR